MPPLWYLRWALSIQARGSRCSLPIGFGKHRLERALEQATRERLDAFARSSGIPGRLEQIVRRGDVDDCATSELDARTYDVYVLAIKHDEGSARNIAG